MKRAVLILAVCGGLTVGCAGSAPTQDPTGRATHASGPPLVSEPSVAVARDMEGAQGLVVEVEAADTYVVHGLWAPGVPRQVVGASDVSAEIRAEQEKESEGN